MSDKINLFGKIFSSVGSSDSNFLIKTKGDVKIQWGNKFIDLIKNGKIVSEQQQSNSLPSGTIIMFNGSEIPKGWAICDGTNGTPNLVGKFIKAVGDLSSVGENIVTENEENETYLTKEQLPVANTDITTTLSQNDNVTTKSIITINEQVVSTKPIKIEPNSYQLVFIMKL